MPIEPTTTQFVIASRRQAEKLLASDEPFEHIISISNPEEGPKDANCPRGISSWAKAHGQDKLLRLKFYDLEKTNHSLAKFFMYTPPSPEDVKQIIDFAHTLKGPTLVHCDAGISRSSAACIICLYALGGDEDRAIETARRIKPDIAPNRLMLLYADQMLGSSLGEAIRSLLW